MKSYRGYSGSIEFSEEDMVFHGRLLGIRDLVTFEAETATDLVRAFRESVDDYLQWHETLDRDPQKPYSGKVALRMPKETHALADLAAKKSGKSLNQWITDTIDEAARDGDHDGSVKVGIR